MKYNTIFRGLFAAFIATASASASAQTTVTMNQPDNGFYEGPSPEWATLHSTDSHGTEVHRQYHRDAVKTLHAWLEQHRQERGTSAYNRAHRDVVQERNMLHRQFHTAPVTAADVSTSVKSTASANPPSNIAVDTGTETPTVAVSEGRPSRRSIVAAAERQNKMRDVLQ